MRNLNHLIGPQTGIRIRDAVVAIELLVILQLFQVKVKLIILQKGKMYIHHAVFFYFSLDGRF